MGKTTIIFSAGIVQNKNRFPEDISICSNYFNDLFF